MSYTLLTILLWPLIFFYTLKIALRVRSMRYFQQRLGYNYHRLKNKPIWIHCASVGEVNTFIPLLKRLVETYPSAHFLITTTTPTGAQLVKKYDIKNTYHHYLPVDSYFSVRRFLNTCQPRICLIMETEIWPHLFKLVNNKHIPLHYYQWPDIR